MEFGELSLLAVGLAMDAFAVSVCKGLSFKKVSMKEASVCGLWFGFFQFLMPMIGYLLGSTLAGIIDKAAPWVAFVILALIGINMMREAFSADEEANPGLGFKVMLAAAVATSIDALAVGITFVAIPVTVLNAPPFINTLFATVLIGLVTFFISALGTFIGGVFGTRYRAGAEAAGGIILIFIGLKSLIDRYELFNGENPDTVFWLLIPFLGTVLGALLVFFFKERPAKTFQQSLIGISAGIMFSASIWCLMIPSFDLSSDLGKYSFLPVFIGFWAGILFQFVLDKSVPHVHEYSGEIEGPKSDATKTIKMMLAMVIHHVSEGIAVGAVYAGFLYGSGIISRYAAIALTIGMMIQNFPEAAFLSVPIKQEGLRKSLSFLYGIVSGAVEPLLGIVTFILSGIFPKILPYIMSLSAGAMIFTVIESMIPEMSNGGHSDKVVISFAAGFSLMMLLAYLLPAF